MKEKDVFDVARERGEELIKKRKKESILQTFTESDLVAAENRLQAAAKTNDEEAFIKAKAEIESLKNRAEMAKIRKEMGIESVISSDMIKEIFVPVKLETAKEHKRILLELADALEKVMNIAVEGCKNINRYNALIDFWRAYVLQSSEAFPFEKEFNTGFFMNMNFAYQIEKMREVGNGRIRG